MKIEIWSDMVCPFCYMGKKKLEEALEQFPHKEQVEIEFKSFQLDPNTPPYTGQDFYESMALKYGTVEESKQMMAGVIDQGKAVGIDFHFDTMKPTNTFNAHRLTHFAKEHNKNAIVTEKIFYANFTQSKDISNIEVLAEIAEEAGLNKEEVLTTLQDEQAYAEDVQADISKARQIGVRAVPHFVFDGEHVLSGALQTEAFTQMLEKIWQDK